MVSLLAGADGRSVNRAGCVHRCDAGTTLYFKHVYGGTVLAVVALCVLLLAIHCVALARHERGDE